MPLAGSKLVENHHIGVTVRLREENRVGTAMASTTTNATASTNNDDENSSRNLLGATIKIKRGKFAGMIGKIVECIEAGTLAEKNVFKGKWYITDNLKISNAFQEHAFDVLVNAGGDRMKKIDAVGDGGSGDSAVKDNIFFGAVKRTAKNSSTDKEEVRGDVHDKQLKQVPMSDTLHERSLVGATISINKGKYKGFTGVVLEKMCVRRIQVDTVPVPLVLEDVQVLQYADTYTSTSSKDDGHRDSDGDNHLQQKLMGAKVRCISNEYFGTLGTIIQVLNLGNWYITDNPKIATALRASMFDVVKYADAPIICIDGNDGEEDEKFEIRGKEIVADATVVKPSRGNPVNNDKYVGLTMDEQQHLPDSINEESIHHLRIRDEEKKSQHQRALALIGEVNEKPNYVAINQTEPGPRSFQENLQPAENDLSRAPVLTEKKCSQGPTDDNNGKLKDDRDRDYDFAKSLVYEDRSNERSDAQTRVDDRESLTAKTNRMEVCSAKLPTIESIELAARLSAFDHVLFLGNGSDTGDGGSLNTMKASNDFAEINQVEGSSTVCKNHIDGEASTKCASVVAPAVVANGGHPRATQTKNNDMLATFINNLIQRNLKSHNFPTVKVIPGMEILVEEKQQPLRIVPLEEQIVRLVPGSLEESSELSKRLSAFDDYLLFL
ncbi:hypothetical protein ACHAXA_011175 [Cyclostephanos tholiformis]|uniref:KOW domain-containing protein n=1 Tax=Cyclostephanos tholiformis TaxID=382380 RepID=A0ABD3RBN4_9STRA